MGEGENMFFTATESPVLVVHASAKAYVTVDPMTCDTRVAIYAPETIGLVPNLRDGGWAITMQHRGLADAMDYAVNMCRFYSLPIAR